MPRIGRMAYACLTILVASVTVAAFTLSQSSAYSGGSTDLVSASLLGNPLVVPAGDLWFSGQRSSAERSKRMNPLAVRARERSRTEYANLASLAVRRLITRSFPAEIDQAAGGKPKLPTGARTLAYRTSHAMEILLPGHRLGVVESSSPIAERRGKGRFEPLNMALVPTANGYSPALSDVAVRIPRGISSGVEIPDTGVTVTPVDSHGRAASGRGALEPASVLYANTQLATDTIAKPTPEGFQLDAVLRSVDSPQELYFRVSAPQNFKLTQDRGTGVVRVVSGGRTLATVLPPSATDSAETNVPTSMRVRGHDLIVSIAHRSASYLYPIEVDPEVNDGQLAETSAHKRSNWEFRTSNSGRFAGKATYEGVGKEHLETKGTAEYAATEWAYWGYETKGNSKIYELKAKTSAKNKGAKIESFLEFEASGGSEKPKKMLSNEYEEPEYSEKTSTICAWNASKVEECLPGAGKEKNAVHFQQSATASPGGSYGFSDSMGEGIVSISEPAGTHSTAGFNTTSSELEFEIEKAIVKRKNALYGSGRWLSKSEDALQMNAADPGIGVAATKLEYENSPGAWIQLSKHEYLEKENSCQGVQCYASHSEFWTLDPKLPDGEDKIRYRAEEAVPGTSSLESEGLATVHVDATPPHLLTLRGLPYGEELSERPYELTGEATDGEGSTIASSGIKSITLYVDGSQYGSSGGSCGVAKGACSASFKWTINGAQLGAGHHTIVLIALDNAGNETRSPLSISVRHSTPVAIGPGSVDLQSGDFTLGATDVSLGSGLTVSRAYSSRAVDGSQGDPLGPQWNLSVGADESLSEMVDHSVLLTSANGGRAIFAKQGENEYESPVGDSNLKLTVEENAKKERIAYYLTDAAKHTSVKFTQPAPGSAWMPTKQEGTTADDTVTYSYGQSYEPLNRYAIGSYTEAASITAGPNKESALWYTNYKSKEIGRMTTSGFVSEYAVGAKTKPYKITAGPDGNLWFTEQEGTDIGKITPAGAVTEYALGTTSKGIAAGPDGNVWFTTTNKVGVITKSGSITQYSLPKEAQLGAITTGPDGNLWFVETGENGKIGKITPSGSVLAEYSIPTKTSATAIAAGPDGDIWFSVTGLKDSIIKMSTSGTVLGEYSDGAREISSLVAGAGSYLWFSSGATGRVGRVTTSGSITERASPSESKDNAVALGPDEDPWFIERGSKRAGDNVDKLDAVTGIIVSPTEVSAPKPAGVSCSPEMKPGCRSLKLTYASVEAAGSEYPRLSKVSLVAYDPISKAMKETAVAQYSYGGGRLQWEWDPRTSSSATITYGYDSEGHVTAMTPAGREPWMFIYGVTDKDPGTGRLIKVARPSASTELEPGWLERTQSPAITGTPVQGVRLAVSDGGWAGTPLAFGYQWERCNESGQACAAIDGAINANYTPTAGDVGYRLKAVVTATTAGGSVSASALSAKVGATGGGTYEIPASESVETTIEEGQYLTSVSCVPGTSECVAVDEQGDAYYSQELSANHSVEWKKWTGPGGYGGQAISCPTSSHCLLGMEKGLYYATSLKGSWTLAHSAIGEGIKTISCPTSEFCADGRGSSTVDYSHSPFSTSWSSNKEARPLTGLSCVKPSLESCVGVDGQDLMFPNKTVESWPWTATPLWDEGYIEGLACASSSACVAVDNDGQALAVGLPLTEANYPPPLQQVGQYRLRSVTCPTSSVCVAVDERGSIFVSTDAGQSWSEAYHSSEAVEYTSVSCTSVSLCVAVGSGVRVFKATTPASGEGEVRSAPVSTAIEYGVGLSGGSGLPNMTAGEVAKWGQADDPVEATAILPADASQSSPASNLTRATAYYLDESGRLVNVSSPSEATYGDVSTSEYNEYNDVIRTLSAKNRQTALEVGAKSVEVSKLLDTIDTYNGEGAHESEVEEPGTRLIDTLGPQHEIKYREGSALNESLARLHTKYFYDEGAPGGEHYDLVTKTTELAQLVNEEEREVRHTTTSYSGQSGLGWTLRAPTSVTKDPEGKKITTTTLYNSTTGQVSETRGAMGTGGESPRDARFVYYGAEANTEGYSSCGGHPEWAGLVCETLPAKQPGGGAPPLSVTAVTAYNMFNEPETTTETFGSTVRTKKETYDAGGRLLTSETTSSADTSLPKVSNEYNSETGVLEKQSTTVGGKTQTVTTKYNALGQLAEYTDADGNTAKYAYGGAEDDDLLEEMSDGSAGGTGRQVYSYNATTKRLEKLWDSAAGTFTASYDVEGDLTSEVYPNGMCANTTVNSVGEATAIAYVKTTKCSEAGAPVWFNESIVPSAYGQMFTRASTLSSESYAYDSLGRLVETQETPAGGECSVRLYAYDDESDRTSQTTRTPGGGGKCATEGGTTQEHTYDEADRLADAGTSYDAFGNITKLSAADAEGHELSTSFYVDNAVASQSQNGTTTNYYLDPEGRVRETVSGATKTIDHYDAPGEAVSWTSEGGGKGIRNIAGIGGVLAATQTNGETPVLQLQDLQGNIIATASLSSEATKLLSTYDSTEFGVPNGGKTPPKYAWLGSSGIASSLPSGVITYGATSYVPQIGRALQAEEVEPPGLSQGSGAGATYVHEMEPWNMQGAAQEGAEAPGLEAARERTAAEAALEVVDPWKDTPMDRQKAEKLGEEFWEWEATAQVLGFYDLPSDFLEILGKIAGEYVAQFGDAIAWAHDAGEKLVKCAKNKRPAKENICDFHVDENELKLEVLGIGGTLKWPNFTVEPRVEECKYAGSLLICGYIVGITDKEL